ncbi:MAG TPA: zf-HC2 domain-containing protein [Deltaproteobacteria bacterium]|nr:zf-HC2 domain-containing protein [Deltaproteobacteria bacterium]
MRCREARDRLVAFQDGELSRSEREQLVEHLTGCTRCRELEQRLRAVTPAPEPLQPPLHVQRRLRLALDVDTILTAAGDRPEVTAPGPIERLLRWLRRDLELPAAAAVAYVVILAAALGWGASNWWSLSTLQQQRYAATHGPATQDSPAIPAEHWRPAAYNPTTYGLAPAKFPELSTTQGPIHLWLDPGDMQQPPDLDLVH